MLRQSNDLPRAKSLWKRLFILLVIGLAAVAAAGLRASADPQKTDAAQADNALSGGLPAPTDPKETIRVVTLFKVQREDDSPIGEKRSMSDAAWNTYCRTQIALIKSTWLLQSALRDPIINTLPILMRPTQPIPWLQQHLQVGFDSGSEIMYVLMYCSPDDVDQTRQLVDAVTRAYEDQALSKDRSQKLAMIDALRKSFDSLNNELRRNTQKYLDVARELGSSAADGGIRMQVELKQLDRVDAELLRVEGQMMEARFSGDNKNKEEFYEQRIAMLTKQVENLKATIAKASEKSVDLTELKEKIDQSQKLANEMALKLQVLQFQVNAPMQIQRLYPEAIADQVEAPSVLTPKPGTPR